MNNISAAAPPVCAITGGSAGIGLAVGLRLAYEGWNLAICGRDAVRLRTAVQQIRSQSPGCQCLAHSADLCERQAASTFITAAFQHFGSLDMLVNNAAVAPLGQLVDLPDEIVEETLNLNHRAVLEAIRTAWPLFQRRGGGLIVNISSQAAIDPFPGFSLYGASKTWLDALTRSLAKEGQDNGIRLYSVQPGAVETDLLRSAFPNYPAEHALAPSVIAEVVFGLTDPAFQPASGAAIPIKSVWRRKG